MPKQPWHLYAPEQAVDRLAQERPPATKSSSPLDEAALNWMRPVADAPITMAVALDAAARVRGERDG
jgi:hypothetical protein